MTDKMTMAQAINLALHDAMEADKTVLVLGEDVGDAEGGGVVGISGGLSQKFGTDRVKSTPITEQAIMGAAIGASMIGFKPVAEIMLMNFTTVASDMIVNHAAKLRFMSGGQTSVPIVVRTMTGAGMANGGQHSDYLEAWFAHTAGLKVVLPSNPADAYGLMRSAIDDPDPVIFIECLPALFTPGPGPERGKKVPIGKANIVREGRDVSVIAYGRLVGALAAMSDKLREDGIEVEVIDPLSLLPLDVDTIYASIDKTGRLLIAHEDTFTGGWGAELAARVAEDRFDSLRAPIRRVAGHDVPLPVAPVLEDAVVPSVQRIAEQIRSLANTSR